jgi:DNA-directed RNA polymerase subunit RPC12/RpoP
MLIKCAECGREVSDRAPACPACGNPIGATTIEATAKRYKANQLLAFAASCLGILLLLSETTRPLGFFVILIGIIWWIVARFGAWWHHG